MLKSFPSCADSAELPLDGADRALLFVGSAAGEAVEFRPGETDEFLEVVFPDDLDCVGIVFRESLEPKGDFVGGHGCGFARQLERIGDSLKRIQSKAINNKRLLA